MASARSATWLVVPILVVGACGDGPNGVENPAGGVAIALEAQAGRPVIGADEQLAQTINCNVLVRATAQGIGTASWKDATVYWYAGVDRSFPLDSAVILESQVRQAWGRDEITSGETQEARWEIGGYEPFAFRFRHRYQAGPGGDIGTATATFTCGPEIPPDPAPPEIPDLLVQVPAGPVEPGDTVTVRYTATSALGLWETRVVVSGGCDVTRVFGEALTTTATRAVPFIMPPTCQLGVPVSVGVGARDAAMQERTSVNANALTPSDVTPPHVLLYSFPAPSGALRPGVSGTYFEDDTLQFMIEATDNGMLRSLYWEVQPSGFRDSLAVAENAASPLITLPLRHEWVGEPQLRVYARDAAGLVSDTVTSEPGDLRILATFGRASAVATITGIVADVAIDDARGVLYVLQPWEHRIAVLETATLTTTSYIATPDRADDIDITPGGDSLLLTFPLLRALGVVDLRPASREVTLVPLASVDTTLDQMPHLVRTTANGKAFVRFGGGNPAGWTLLELDLASGDEVIRTDAGQDGNVGAALLERSHDHTALVLLLGPTLQKYETATDAFATAQPARRLGNLTVDATGQVAAVGLDLYDGSLQFLREAESGYPLGAAVGVYTALTPSGEYLFQSLPPWGILRARVADGALLDRMRSPLGAASLRMSDDGTQLVELYYDYATTTSIRVIHLN